MKNRKSGFKVLMLVLLLLINFSASAQKDKIQKNNFRAPINVKIDGKLNEWGDKLQAYNTSTDIFYTISNDDDNLYLAVAATKNNTLT